MKAVIVDDEKSGRSRLTRLLAVAHSDVEVVGEARDGLEAVKQIDLLKPDLVMADAAATEIAVSERQAPTLRRRLPGL